MFGAAGANALKCVAGASTAGPGTALGRAAMLLRRQNALSQVHQSPAVMYLIATLKIAQVGL